MLRMPIIAAACVIIEPFGKPVVPEVKNSIATSSSVAGSTGSMWSGAFSMTSRTLATPSGAGFCPTIAQRFTPGTLVVSLIVASHTISSITSSSTPAFCTTNSISLGRSMKFIGTGMAPMRARPKFTNAISMRFIVMRPTRSPFRTPSARIAPPNRFTSRPTSR